MIGCLLVFLFTIQGVVSVTIDYYGTGLDVSAFESNSFKSGLARVILTGMLSDNMWWGDMHGALHAARETGTRLGASNHANSDFGPLFVTNIREKSPEKYVADGYRWHFESGSVWIVTVDFANGDSYLIPETYAIGSDARPTVSPSASPTETPTTASPTFSYAPSNSPTAIPLEIVETANFGDDTGQVALMDLLKETPWWGDFQNTITYVMRRGAELGPLSDDPRLGPIFLSDVQELIPGRFFAEGHRWNFDSNTVAGFSSMFSKNGVLSPNTFVVLNTVSASPSVSAVPTVSVQPSMTPSMNPTRDELQIAYSKAFKGKNSREDLMGFLENTPWWGNILSARSAALLRGSNLGRALNVTYGPTFVASVTVIGKGAEYVIDGYRWNFDANIAIKHSGLLATKDTLAEGMYVVMSMDEIPTFEPSAVPSLPPSISVMPSTSPSVASSSLPSALPSSIPSMPPSSFPSIVKAPTPTQNFERDPKQDGAPTDIFEDVPQKICTGHYGKGGKDTDVQEEDMVWCCDSCNCRDLQDKVACGTPATCCAHQTKCVGNSKIDGTQKEVTLQQARQQKQDSSLIDIVGLEWCCVECDCADFSTAILANSNICETTTSSAVPQVTTTKSMQHYLIPLIVSTMTGLALGPILF